MVQITPCQPVEVSVKLQNVGDAFTSDEVTQVYLTWPKDVVQNIATHTDAIRMVNFTKSDNVKPGEQRSVSLRIEPAQMVTVTTFDYEFRPVIEPGVYTVYVTDTFETENEKMMHAQFEIVGDETDFKKCV